MHSAMVSQHLWAGRGRLQVGDRRPQATAILHMEAIIRQQVCMGCRQYTTHDSHHRVQLHRPGSRHLQDSGQVTGPAWHSHQMDGRELLPQLRSAVGVADLGQGVEVDTRSIASDLHQPSVVRKRNSLHRLRGMISWLIEGPTLAWT